MTDRVKYLNRFGDWRSVTVTYRRADGNLVCSRVGYGHDYAGALRDADQQLRPGSWLRVSISQPSSIRADVQNDGRFRNHVQNRPPGEGEIVVVAEPRVRRPTKAELSDA